jgi:hypothetical protein
MVAFLASMPVAPLAADEIDDYVAKQIEGQNIPGLSLAVVKNGKVIKAKGYGLANLEWNVPATADTAYQLASVSKQFTATAIMLPGRGWQASALGQRDETFRGIARGLEQHHRCGISSR